MKPVNVAHATSHCPSMLVDALGNVIWHSEEGSSEPVVRRTIHVPSPPRNWYLSQRRKDVEDASA